MQDNLTLAMHYFGKLNDAERELFLSVASSKKQVVAKPKKKKELPYQYTEDYFYNKLKKEWIVKAEKRQAKLKAKQ